jgi:transaldolase
LAKFVKAGIDLEALASKLLEEGATSFAKSWNDLMARIESKLRASRSKPLEVCLEAQYFGMLHLS